MSNTPTCSILLPSRNRVQLLKAAIDNFLDTASDPSRVEIIVRVHDDDPETLAWVKDRPRGIRFVVGDTDDSYGSMSDYVNSIAAVSKGDWLWPAPDDGKVQTQGWDKILEARLADPRHACLALWTLLQPSQLNIISRGLYRAVGLVGMTEHCETYMQSLAKVAGILETVDINYPHFHIPSTAPRDRKKTWAEFRGEEVSRCFNLDKLKLGAVLGRPITDPWTPSMLPDGIT